MKNEEISESASECRVTPRYVFEARILILVHREDKKLNIEGWARDISESGLGAFVGQDLERGESVTLQIPLSNSPKELINAKVTAQTGTRYGFQFTALSPEQRARIRSITKNQTPIPFTRGG